MYNYESFIRDFKRQIESPVVNYIWIDYVHWPMHYAKIYMYYRESMSNLTDAELWMEAISINRALIVIDKWMSDKKRPLASVFHDRGFKFFKRGNGLSNRHNYDGIMINLRLWREEYIRHIKRRQRALKITSNWGLPGELQNKITNYF